MVNRNRREVGLDGKMYSLKIQEASKCRLKTMQEESYDEEQ